MKTILITGSSRGIGFLAAKTLAAKGHFVFATMRDPAGRNKEAAVHLTEYSSLVDGEIRVLDMDVTVDQAVEDAMAEAESVRAIDVLINNVGVMPVGLTEAYTLDQVQQTIDTNFYSIVRTSRAILPKMRARGAGRLIHISSAAGRLALPFFGIYCASKWAMEAYAEALNTELDGTGVSSILVEPSGHATDLVETAPRASDAAIVAAYGNRAAGADKMLAMFQGAFAKGDAINDAQNIANLLVDLSEADTPPLRTAIGDDMGVAAINEATAPIHEQVIGTLKGVYEG